MPQLRNLTLGMISLLAITACGDDGHTHTHNEEEVITTVMLTFTPSSGAPVVATFNDADGDGGAAPTIDALTLTKGVTYTTTVKFENRLESPAEDITAEVKDEGDQHQVFFTGTAVNGPASSTANAPLTHAYGDTDANGLPIGLSNTFTSGANGGTGQLEVTLRHMPPVNNAAVKTAGAAETVKASGFSTLGGESDASVTFSVTVQ